ncbi:ORF2 [Bemisia tabaci arlivirus 2]|uniref:ORF2 n=1 Tax=Bemisia tabaci arlivirus 2 TaxID=2840018 RepID=A0A8E8FTJ5_9MONO|nr:ORF2 [Bemisia tabaci arlivirus 2]QWC36462.1 ORF2 [Bemisia tabaci arlivirus 2]
MLRKLNNLFADETKDIVVYTDKPLSDEELEAKRAAENFKQLVVNNTRELTSPSEINKIDELYNSPEFKNHLFSLLADSPSLSTHDLTSAIRNRRAQEIYYHILKTGNPERAKRLNRDHVISKSFCDLLDHKLNSMEHSPIPAFLSEPNRQVLEHAQGSSIQNTLASIVSSDFKIDDFSEAPRGSEFPTMPVFELENITEENESSPEASPKVTGAKKKSVEFDPAQKSAYDYHTTFLENMACNFNEEKTLADRLLDTKSKGVTDLAFQVAVVQRLRELDQKVAVITANQGMISDQLGDLASSIAGLSKGDPLANKNWEAMFNMIRAINANMSSLHVSSIRHENKTPNPLANQETKMPVQPTTLGAKEDESKPEDTEASGIMSRAEFDTLDLDAKKGYIACFGRIFSDKAPVTRPKEDKMQVQMERKADHTAPKNTSYATTISTSAKVDSLEAAKQRLAMYADKGIVIEELFPLRDALRKFGTKYFAQLKSWVEGRPPTEMWSATLKILHTETANLPLNIKQVIISYTEKESLIALLDAILKLIS